MKLLLGNRSDGALSSASAAIDALIGIDFILAVAEADSVDGALSLAGTASDTFVGNLMCHDFILLYRFNPKVTVVGTQKFLTTITYTHYSIKLYFCL